MGTLLQRLSPAVLLCLAACGGGGGGNPSTYTFDGGHFDGGSAVASSTIGPSGGIVQLGQASITIPPGALSRATTIRLSLRTDTPPSRYQSYSPFYEFDPAGLTFALPATVVLPEYGAPSSAAVYWSSGAGNVYTRLASSRRGSLETAQVTHFSGGFVGTTGMDASVEASATREGGRGDATTPRDATARDATASDVESGCLIGLVPYAAAQTNPTNSCQSCQPGTSPSSWTNLPDGAGCGRGGSCFAGACESAVDGGAADVGSDATVSDATASDATVSDATVPDATTPDATAPDATVPDATLSDAASDTSSQRSFDSGLDGSLTESIDGGGGDASSVTCTFVSESSGCGPTCTIPPPVTITVTNVPMYIGAACDVPSSLTATRTDGLVLDAPEIWARWPVPTYSFCLGPSSGMPGELISATWGSGGQPRADREGQITIAGTQATVSLNGTYAPEYYCSAPFTGWSFGCVRQTVTCSGTGTALLSTCLTNNGGCDPNATCTWTGPTSNSCSCNAGYVGDGGACSPAPNPCTTNNGGCSVNATCANNGGVPVCTCNVPYVGDGGSCQPG